LLCHRLVASSLLPRQLLLTQRGQEHRFELEPLGTVVREQVDAAGARAARVVAPAELGDECRSVAVEGGGERDEAGQIVLPDGLALTERIRNRRQPPGLERS